MSMVQMADSGTDWQLSRGVGVTPSGMTRSIFKKSGKTLMMCLHSSLLTHGGK